MLHRLSDQLPQLKFNSYISHWFRTYGLVSLLGPFDPKLAFKHQTLGLSSLIHLMCVIACAHTSTHPTSLMHVKKARTTFVYDTYCLGHWNEENENIKHQTE